MYIKGKMSIVANLYKLKLLDKYNLIKLHKATVDMLYKGNRTITAQLFMTAVGFLEAGNYDDMWMIMK